MAELQLIKRPGGVLHPANQADADRLEKVRNGALLYGDFKQPRNPAFHRRFFAMLNFAFELWEPAEVEHRGMKAEKNFDRFRRDAMILAGFRRVVTNIKGEVRVEAESISFASMDETQFQDVYRKCFDVTWRLVLSKVRGLTEEQAENLINEALSYDG